MFDDSKIEAGVCLECKECKRKTNFPALKVVPGIKCSYCGAVIELDPAAMASKAVMLMTAECNDDVSVDW